MNKSIIFSCVFLTFALAIAKDLPRNEPHPFTKLLPKADDIRDPDVLRLFWQHVILYASMENIIVPPQLSASVTNSLVHKMHLRGMHKIHALEDMTPSINGTFQATAIFDKVEFRAASVINQNTDPAEVRMRFMISNLKMRVNIIEIMLGEVRVPIVVRMTQIGEPNIEPIIRYPGSMFGVASISDKVQVAAVVDQIKHVLIPQAISQAFSDENLAVIATSQRELTNELTKYLSAGNTQMAEPHSEVLNYYLKMYLVYFKVMMVCEHYNLDDSTSFEFEQNVDGVPTTGTVRISGGDVQGGEYYRRDFCVGPTCWIVEYPEGTFVFRWDEIYATYDIDVDYMGSTYNGKLVITDSGYRTKEDYVQDCGLWCIIRYRSRTILNAGEMHANVDGLPASLNFLEPQLNAVAVDLQNKMFSKISRAYFPDSSLVGTHCGFDVEPE